MTGTMMTLQQQPATVPAQSSASLLGQRFEETRREVLRLRRTNEYLRETLSTHEHIIGLLEGIRECLERRNDDLMEGCTCKHFMLPEHAYITRDDLNELYTQYFHTKQQQGLPVNLSGGDKTNGSVNNHNKFKRSSSLTTLKLGTSSNGSETSSTTFSTSSSSALACMPSPCHSPALSTSSKLSMASSAAAILSLSAALAAAASSSPASTTTPTTSYSSLATLAAAATSTLANGSSNGGISNECYPVDLKSDGEESNEMKIDLDYDDEELVKIKDEHEDNDEDEPMGDSYEHTNATSPSRSTSYSELQINEESNDRTVDGQTRLPILKSMLSPADQSEEQIEITLNPNDFISNGAANSNDGHESSVDMTTKNNKSASPSSTTAHLDETRDTVTTSSRYNVSSSSADTNSQSSNGSMLSNANSAAALLANSLQMPSSPGPMPSSMSNLRIALSSKKPNVPSTMLATIAAANGLNINMDTIRPHKCHWPDCKFATKDRKTLRTHMRIHTKEKPFKCSFPNCSYETGDPSNYRKHKRRHIAHTIFACDYEGCNFTTNKPDFMQSHIAIHKGLKPFLCDFENCSSSFYTRNKLENHRRKHLASGEFPMSLTHVEDKDKPIMCTYPNCGKRFINAAGLAGHEVTHLATHDKYGAFLAEHEREKPVVCNFPNCGKRFLNTAGLAGHEVTHRNFINQNMGAIFKNLSFNQLKQLGVFSVNAKQNGGSAMNGSGSHSVNSSNGSSPQSNASSQQAQQQQQAVQLQQLQHAQLLLSAVQKAGAEAAAAAAVAQHKSQQDGGQVIVLDI